MKFLTTMTAAVLAVCAASSACQHDAGIDERATSPVLMICEHGSVKSLMAASLFNQAAMKRQLPFRAISRGVSPDRAVPPAIAAALARDGHDVRHFVPTKVSTTDLRTASRVVAISLDPAGLDLEADAPVAAWLDVPSASADYASAKASLERHVDSLLDDLERGRAR
jgi:arsenate reductase (thioredoxin)